VLFVLENFETTNIWSVLVPKEFQTNTMVQCSRCWHTFQPFKCGLFKRFTMIRMSDINECVSSLAKCLPKEVGNSMFSDNVVDMSPCGHHSCTWTKRLHFVKTFPICCQYQDLYLLVNEIFAVHFFIVALCMLLWLFLLFQLMHTFIHFKNTDSH